MKITLRKAGVFSAMSMAALGIMSASAMGMPHMSNLTPDEMATKQSQMFADQAALIGATPDEVKNAWAEGKDLRTLAKEKGITDEQMQAKMKAKHNEQLKTQLASMVSKGIITQAQADKRLATMQAKASTNKTDGKAGKHGMRGMMGGF